MSLHISVLVLMVCCNVVSAECNLCSNPMESPKPTSCDHTQPSSPYSDQSSTLPLAERGYCLAGDYDILVSRFPLLNMTIKNISNCISLNDSYGTQKFLSSSTNFAKYRYFTLPGDMKPKFQFKVINTFSSVWEAYVDFRRRSSIIVDSNTQYDDLYTTLTNIGSGKQANLQSYYKKFQRSLLDKRVPFYHLRAQIVHGEFEMKKSHIQENQLQFSSHFLEYIQQHLLYKAENISNSEIWKDRFFLLFGTHYLRRALFGGYIDLMVTPWDTICELPPKMDLSSLAKCTAIKFNKKFGLEENASEISACSDFEFWTLHDQDVLSVISGSNYDFQVAMTIVLRYPLYADSSDTNFMQEWIGSLYDSPGVVEATVEPICELLAENEGNLKEECKWNLLRYMRSNEPLLRTTPIDQNEECAGGAKRMTFDSGLNIFRSGCLSTVRSSKVCHEEEGNVELSEPPNNAANHPIYYCSFCSIIFAVLFTSIMG